MPELTNEPVVNNSIVPIPELEAEYKAERRQIEVNNGTGAELPPGPVMPRDMSSIGKVTEGTELPAPSPVTSSAPEGATDLNADAMTAETTLSSERVYDAGWTPDAQEIQAHPTETGINNVIEKKTNFRGALQEFITSPAGFMMDMGADMLFRNTENEFYGREEEGFIEGKVNAVKDKFMGVEGEEGQNMNRFMVGLSPFIAMQNGLLRPIAAEYEEGVEGMDKFGLILEQMAQGVGEGLSPEYGEELESYGTAIAEKHFPEMSPDNQKYLGIFLDIVADPAILVGGPLLKVAKWGVSSLVNTVKGSEKLQSGVGVFQNGMDKLGETIINSAMGKQNPDLVSELNTLARTADKGGEEGKAALMELNERINEIPEVAETIKKAEMGDVEKLMVEQNEKLGALPEGQNFRITDRDPDLPLTEEEILYKRKYPGEDPLNIELDLVSFNSADDLEPLLEAIGKRATKNMEALSKQYPDDTAMFVAKHAELTDVLGISAQQMDVPKAIALKQGLLATSELLSQRASAAVRSGSKIDQLAYDKTVAIFKMLQEQATGVKNNGREILDALRVKQKSSTGRIAEMNEIMAAAKSASTYSDQVMMHTIAELRDPNAVAKVLSRKNVGQKIYGAFVETVINSMISGLDTQGTNLSSNTAMLFMTPTQSLTSVLTAAARGDLKAARTNMAETAGQFTGLVHAVGDMFKIASKKSDWQKQGLPDQLKYTHEIDQQRLRKNITSEELELTGFWGQFADISGKTIRVPGAALVVADRGFKIANYRMHTAGEAARRASMLGGTADEQRTVMNTLRHNPDDNLLAQSIKIAEQNTFTEELGDTASSIHKFISQTPMLPVLLPFFKTITNIEKRGLRDGMFGAMWGRLKVAKDKGTRHEKDVANARIALGLGMPVGIVGLLGDNITGSLDYNTIEGRNAKRLGHPEYAILLGNDENGKPRYWDYGRYEPLRMVLGMAVNYRNAFNNLRQTDPETGEPNPFLEDLGMAIVSPFVQTALDNYMVETVGGIVGVLETLASGTPDMTEKAIAKLGITMVSPNFVNQMNSKYFDDNFRKAHDLLDQFQKRTPGLSQFVPIKVTPWGDTMKKPDTIGPDYVSKFYSYEAAMDKYDKEIEYLKVELSDPPKFIKVAGLNQPLELTGEQRETFARLRGKGAQAGSPAVKDIIKMTMDAPDWAALPQAEKKQRIQYIWNKASEATRKFVLMNDPAYEEQYKQRMEWQKAEEANQKANPRNVGVQP